MGLSKLARTVGRGNPSRSIKRGHFPTTPLSGEILGLDSTPKVVGRTGGQPPGIYHPRQWPRVDDVWAGQDGGSSVVHQGGGGLPLLPIAGPQTTIDDYDLFSWLSWL